MPRLPAYERTDPQHHPGVRSAGVAPAGDLGAEASQALHAPLAASMHLSPTMLHAELARLLAPLPRIQACDNVIPLVG